MKLSNIAALSLIMLSSIASAKVAIEASVVNNRSLVIIPKCVLDENQSNVEFIDDMRIQATLDESKTVTFDLAKKDENDNFVSFAQPSLVINSDETTGEFEYENGFVFIVRVNEIKE